MRELPRLRPNTNAAAARSLSSTRRIRDIVTSQNSSMIIDRKERFHIKDESAWATRDEEKNEISTQLISLRKRHDVSKDQLSQREQQLQGLEHDIKHLSMIEENVRKGQSNLQEHVEVLEAESARIRGLMDKAKDERYMYEHLLDRMKVTKLHLELKSSAYMESLKNKKSVLNEQLQRMRKSQEHSFLTRQAFHVVKDLFYRETKDKEGQVTELEKNAKSRKEMATRRDNRQRRQMEIAEAAANEERDSEEVRLREGYLLHKFWCKTLTKKLQKDKAESVQIEEAFQRARAATGLTDVHEIVERYLTREQTYTDLSQAVSDGERKVTRLKRLIEERKKQIKAFEVSADKPLPVAQVSEQDIAAEMKETFTVQEKLQKHTILYEHLQAWGQRMLAQLPPVPEVKDSNPLLALFSRLKLAFQQALTPLKERKELVLQTLDAQAAQPIEKLILQSPQANMRVRSDSAELEELSDKDSEVEREIEEQRRKIKQYAYERQESAKRKKAKEKKQDPKKQPSVQA